jgi:hypothetical protein
MRVVSLASLAIFSVPSCDTNPQCDPGFEFVNGACLPARGEDAGSETDDESLDDDQEANDEGNMNDAKEDAAAQNPGGSTRGPDAATSTMDCSGEESGTEFGTPCEDDTDHSDCSCPAPYCAIQPGNDQGVCTRTGCVEEPEICPNGFRCTDLSVFAPGLPSLCVE